MIIHAHTQHSTNTHTHTHAHTHAGRRLWLPRNVGRQHGTACSLCAHACTLQELHAAGEALTHMNAQPRKLISRSSGHLATSSRRPLGALPSIQPCMREDQPRGAAAWHAGLVQQKGRAALFSMARTAAGACSKRGSPADVKTCCPQEPAGQRGALASASNEFPPHAPHAPCMHFPGHPP